ncbi:MAG: integration host factor, actinobacterial type, partial [Jatrophihabitans sp.]
LLPISREVGTSRPLDDGQRRAVVSCVADARRARRSVGEDLKAERVDLLDVVRRARIEDAVGGMRLAVLLDWLPGFGPAAVARTLAALRIDGKRRLRGLGVRQRAALEKFAADYDARALTGPGRGRAPAPMRSHGG